MFSILKQKYISIDKERIITSKVWNIWRITEDTWIAKISRATSRIKCNHDPKIQWIYHLYLVFKEAIYIFTLYIEYRLIACVYDLPWPKKDALIIRIKALFQKQSKSDCFSAIYKRKDKKKKKTYSICSLKIFLTLDWNKIFRFDFFFLCVCVHQVWQNLGSLESV